MSQNERERGEMHKGFLVAYLEEGDQLDKL
jgi:hypothetical protein